MQIEAFILERNGKKMVIDFHTHIFPEKIAEKTISFLSEKGGIPPYSNGTLEGLLASMKEAKVDTSVVLPVVTATKQFDSIHRFAMEINEREYKECKLVSFGGMHPDTANYKEELNFIAAHGFKGIKLHPDYQETFIDDIKYKRIISYATELGLIVVTHAGFDVGYPDVTHCTPDRTLDMIKDVKPEKLVLAHMGGLNYWDDVERYLVGENVYFDTAYVLDEMEKEQFKRIVKNHGADKILFATDIPWKPQKKLVQDMKELCENMTDIDKDIYHKVMWNNGMKILSL